MPSGTVQQILICVPKVPNTGNSTAPCATVQGSRHEPAMMSAYVLSPTSTLENMSQVVPFDSVNAAAAFAFGVTVVVSCWLIAKPIGLMLELVKKG